jgi:hypothetical protein
MRTSEINGPRFNSDRAIEQTVIAQLTCVHTQNAQDGDPAPFTDRPWSTADIVSAYAYVSMLLALLGAEAEQRCGPSLPEFLQRQALSVASEAGDQAADEDLASPGQTEPPRIEFSDSTGHVIMAIFVTEDGRLDVDGDRSRWTDVATAFVAQLRTALDPDPAGRGPR